LQIVEVEKGGEGFVGRAWPAIHCCSLRDWRVMATPPTPPLAA